MAINEYDKQAKDFLKDTNTEFKAVFLKNGLHFEGDTEERDIYEITLKRGKRIYKFKFGQSLADSGLLLYNLNKERTRHKGFNIPKEIRDKLLIAKTPKEITGAMLSLRRYFEEKYFSLSGLNWEFKKPSAYDVLACLQTYDVGTFEDFCSAFDYEEDSRKAEKTYKAVVEEWKNIKILYTDEEINKLQEIN